MFHDDEDDGGGGVLDTISSNTELLFILTAYSMVI
jgi:hypothetical protein